MKSTELTINVGGLAQCWTEADAAELAVLVAELLSEHERHVREGCAGCRRAARTGPSVDCAIAQVAKIVDASTIRGGRANGAAPASRMREVEWPAGPIERYKPKQRPARTTVTPGSVCPAIVEGCRVVVEWREARIRRSRAERLRLELDAVEWLLEARRQPRAMEQAA